MSYEYLKPYCHHQEQGRLEFPYNSFGKLYPSELEKAEKILGESFPEQLRSFYKEIGVGCLLKPHIVPQDYKFYSSNEILPPLVVANFSKGILEWEGQDHYMAEDTYECLQPGDLPFFEIGDSSSFMVMKPHSDNPNAVWYMGHEKIEDSLEEFIYNLYYDHPSYYTKRW